MKKFLSLLIAATFAVSLTACSDNAGDTGSAENTSASAEIGETAADTEANTDADVSESSEISDPESQPEEVPADTDQPETWDITLEDIRDNNYIFSLLYDSKTVTVLSTVLNTDGTVYGNNTFEFYDLDNGYPAMQALFSSDEVGTSEIMCLANEDHAVEYDIYRGFSGSVSIIPTVHYEAQIDANWDMMYPKLPGEIITNVSEQDGDTLVETYNFDEEYGESYTRSLYYIGENGRIDYKEITMYLVTEDAEIDPYIPYGTDTAPVMSVNTYSVQYGAERTLDLATEKDLTEGDTCKVTAHISEGVYTETQTIDVLKNTVVNVMNRNSVYETYTDEAMTDIFDIEDMSGDEIEIWARNPETAAE